MQGRIKTNSIDQLSEQMYVIVKGTLLGLGGRWLTWPLEYSMYMASDKTNTKPLFTIYGQVFQKNQILTLNKLFLQTGFTQTIGKSLANIGVLHYVDNYYSHLPSTLKGLFASVLSAPIETIVTSRGEYRKVQAFYQSPFSLATTNNWFPPGFSCVLQANFIRNFTTSIITFIGIYKITEMLQPLFPDTHKD